MPDLSKYQGKLMTYVFPVNNEVSRGIFGTIEMLVDTTKNREYWFNPTSSHPKFKITANRKNKVEIHNNKIYGSKPSENLDDLEIINSHPPRRNQFNP